MSNIEAYAKEEMERAGLYDNDADYGAGEIAEEVLKLCRVLGRGGHSGGSHHLVMAIFNKVANYEPLTPLTSAPSEWMDVSEYGGPTGTPVYQSRRKHTCFSNDPAFKSYYDIDEPGRPLHVITPV